MEILGSKPLTLLDFDLENRPLNYLGNDWTGAEVTAVAWAWAHEPSPVVTCWLLTRSGRFKNLETSATLSARKFFELVRETVMSAGMVTGHYIRKHDLPMLNAQCMEHGAAPLGAVCASDTKCDLISRKDLSASQENLAGLLNLPEHKHHMSQSEWREANRLGPDGLLKTHKRVVDDVIQHMALRRALIQRGLLKPPRMWRP